MKTTKTEKRIRTRKLKEVECLRIMLLPTTVRRINKEDIKQKEKAEEEENRIQLSKFNVDYAGTTNTSNADDGDR
mgnify:CR=1 FL=1